MRKRRNDECEGQMFFSFADDIPLITQKPTTGVLPKLGAPKRTKPVKKSPLPADNVYKEFCVVLHELAKKHITRNDFADFETLISCTKLLQEAGLPVQSTALGLAPMTAQCSAVVKLSPQYRALRERATAGLATIGDLESKAPAKGTEEYQRGMRDAFVHASEIAQMFLEDIESLIR